MEKPEGIITEDDTVYEVLTKYPQLKEVMVSISPKFKNLQNPVLFNTVAKVTPLKKAAGIGNIYIKEMLYTLNEAIGKGPEFLAWFKSRIPKMQEEFLKKQFAKEAAATGEKPAWMEKAGTFKVFDARKVDGEPFSFIMNAARDVQPGAGLLLIQSFVPAPIINYLSMEGFEAYTDRSTDGEVRVYLYRKSRGGSNG